MSARRSSTAKKNAARFRALLGARRRDRRFVVLSASVQDIAIALLAFGGGLVLLAYAADPHVRTIAALPPDALRPAVKFFSWLGEGILVYVLCVVLIVFSVVRDLSDHGTRARVHDFTRAAAALYVFAAVVVAGLAAALLKFIIGRARPSLIEEAGPYAFDIFGPSAKWASFPSGHTTTIMSCAAALALLLPRWRVPILIAGVVFSCSRVFIGAHYPTDVLGGIALGALVSWLFARALAQRRVVFRFDDEGRVKPLHYLGQAFTLAPKTARKTAR
ncbi:phosphatase PAP2 family protein [Terrihabitans soli]|nr:phosphatase PAP2 family protein [Terrihabitans soli]